jgi:CDP-diacylglycerol---serine O-phosphatidyltransferase
MTVGNHRRGRPGLQRGIIILPSAFTLGNLFFGVHSMVAATRGDFQWAAWFIVFAAVLDMLDGRIARFTATGSRFGAELDSLVDAVSFGVAPAFLSYQLFFSEGPWSWVVAFIYIMAVVVRLARFNVEQGGEAKRTFHGLPSPTAGMIVATAYPFFTAPGVAAFTGGLPSPQTMGMVLVALALLMLSHIPYPLVPRVSFKDLRAGVGSVALLGCAVAALTVPEYFLFPFLVLYTVWGVSRAMALGLLERLPDQDPLLDEAGPADEGGMELRRLDYGEIAPGRFGASRDHSDTAEDER